MHSNDRLNAIGVSIDLVLSFINVKIELISSSKYI